IGIFIMIVWTLADWLPQEWRRPVGVPVLATSLLACLVVTWFQVRVWKNSTALWEHALAITQRNYLAHLQLAALEQQAERELRDQAKKQDSAARWTLKQAARHEEQAEFHLLAAVRFDPDDARIHDRLGRFYQSHERWAEALPHREKAVQLDPDSYKY